METKKTPRQPTASDVMNMLYLRAQTAAIEQRCVDLYVTDPKLFKKLKDMLAQVLTDLKDEATPYAGKPPESCIDPFVLCNDGICRVEGDCS